jgi:recombination endonuclease VII
VRKPLTEAQREQQRGYMRVWRNKNRKRLNKQNREWRRNNPEKYAASRRRTQLKIRYGMTEQDYARLLEQQDYRCPICLRAFDPNGIRPPVDHDHGPSGKVRGILCSACNRALGWYENNAARIAGYLKEDK